MAVFAEIGSSILLFGLVFGMSATVELKQLYKQIRNRNALAIGMALQFIILPFCGFVVVKCLKLPATMGITLMVITSSPGGSYSNWWCSLFNAELALSVTMTAISTLLSAVMLPANLLLYTRWTYSEAVVQSLDWFALFLELIVVIGGISCGILLSARAKNIGNEAVFHRRANLCGNLAGIALISLSISLNSGSQQASLWDQPASFYIGVALPAVMGVIIATYLATKAELEKPERVAVAVEACYQNTGIATSVAITMFSGKGDGELATAIGVPLYYGIVEATMLGIYCMVCWKLGWTKAPKDENFFAMIWNSYEVEEIEMQQQESTIEVVLHEGSTKEAPLDLVFEQSENGSVFITDDKTLANTKKHTPQRPSRPKTSRTGESNDGAITDGRESRYDEINLHSNSRRLRNRQYSAPPDLSPTATVASTVDEEEQDEQDEGRLQKATLRIKRRLMGYRQPPEDPSARQQPIPSVLEELEVPTSFDHMPDHVAPAEDDPKLTLD